MNLFLLEGWSFIEHCSLRWGLEAVADMRAAVIRVYVLFHRLG